MAVDALEMDEDEGNPANALEEILAGQNFHEFLTASNRDFDILLSQATTYFRLCISYNLQLLKR